MKQLKLTGLVALVGVGIVALAAGGSRLVLNGTTASTQVRVIDSKTYVPLSDVARALGMIVVKRNDGYEIKTAGGANPIKGVLQGKVGDLLFDGSWRFQVLNVQSPASYTITTDSAPYDSAGLSHLNRTTHVLQAKDGYKLSSSNAA